MRVLVPFAALLSVVQALSVPGLLGRELNTCAIVDAELIVPNFQGVEITVGVIDSCICVFDIPTFLETSAVGSQAVAIAGEAAVQSILTQMVNSAAGSVQCNYPANAGAPTCVNGNPCGFVCMLDFVAYPPADPTECVCLAPNQLCDGTCAPPGACPSSTPSKRQAENWWHKRMSCDFGFTACGVSNSAGYQCVDTRTDLESCGGCDIPLHEYSPRGRDCSSIPGVADVSCHNGACRVYECMPGHSISYDNSTCYDEGKFRIAQEDLQKYRAAAGFT